VKQQHKEHTMRQAAKRKRTYALTLTINIFFQIFNPFGIPYFSTQTHNEQSATPYRVCGLVVYDDAAAAVAAKHS